MSLLETFGHLLGRTATESEAPPSEKVDGFSGPGLDRELFRFSDSAADTMCLRDCVEGIFGFGTNGSGKTSSFKTVARTLVRAGFGGVVACVKDDEPEFWREVCREEGRAGDLLEWGEGQGSFNFVDHEQRSTRGTPSMEALGSLLMDSAMVADGKLREDNWIKSGRQLLTSLLTILYCARESVDVRELYEAIISMPPGLADVPLDEREERMAAWEETSTLAAWMRETSRRPHGDLAASLGYVRREWTRLGERTLSSIAITLSSMLDVLRREPLREVLCGATTLTPDDARAGKIILLNMPLQQGNRKSARLGQVIFKAAAQTAFLRQRTGRPVFLWVDEAQEVLSPGDGDFVARCRSKQVVTVFLSQNLPALHARMAAEDGGGVAEARVRGMLGNFNTRVWFLNGDRQTNQAAAEQIGKVKRQRQTVTTQRHGGQTSRSISQQDYEEDLCPPEKFAQLKNGGRRHRYICTAIVCKPGRTWSGKKRYLEARFDQKGRKDLSWGWCAAFAALAGFGWWTFQRAGLAPAAGGLLVRLDQMVAAAIGWWPKAKNARDAGWLAGWTNPTLDFLFAWQGWIFPALTAALTLVIVRWWFARHCARPTLP